MAKAKKTKKTKVRDLKAHKTVKGGSKIAGRIVTDPCDPADGTGKMSHER